MQRKILIAQIGQGSYQMSSYAHVKEAGKLSHGTIYRAGYSFEAVYHQLCIDAAENTQRTEKDVILLTGTESSFWGSLCVYFLKKDGLRDGDRLNPQEEDCEMLRSYLCHGDGILQRNDIQLEKKTNPKVEGILIQRMNEVQVRREVEAFLNAHANLMNAKITIAILQPGLDEEQLQENFTVLKDAIEEMLSWEDGGSVQDSSLVHLCFDITMGYRSLPMYIYTFANYLTRIRPEEFLLHVYYGMAEAKQAEQRSDGSKFLWTPLVNLQKIDELMQWINVVNEFRSYGSVRGLTRLLEAHPDWNVPVEEEEKQRLKDVFTLFDYATNANNLNILESSIQAIARLDESLTDCPGLPAEARPLLLDIAKDFRDRFCQSRPDYVYGYLTIQLAKWYDDQGRLGNAAIALQEGIITYVMERYPHLLYGVELTPENLFDYTKRDIVKKRIEWLADMKEQVGVNFCYVRTNIRNVNSHIVMQQVTQNHIREQQVIFNWLLTYMLEEVQENVIHLDGSASLEACLKRIITKDELVDYLKCVETNIFGGKPSGEEAEKNKRKICQHTVWGTPLEEAFLLYFQAEQEAIVREVPFVKESNFALLQALIEKKEELNQKDRKNQKENRKNFDEKKDLNDNKFYNQSRKQCKKASHAQRLVRFYQTNTESMLELIAKIQ